MASLFNSLTTIAIFAVFAVLCLGLWTLSREGAGNVSQKLMRWRVGLQFLAIIIIMIAVYFRRTA